MRNTYLLVILITISLNLNSQVTITLDSLNGTDVAGSQVIVNHLPTSNLDLPYLYITNTSGSSQDWLITRKNIIQPSDWFNYLCWGNLCYGVSLLDIWSTELATLTDNETKELTTYVGAPTVGNAHYRYYVSSDGINFVDSVDVLVNITDVVGIYELAENKTSIFPNPAQNKVAISGLTKNQYSLMAYDMFGNLVLFDENVNRDEIDLSNLNNGQYILIFENRDTQDYVRHQIIIKN